MSKRVKVKMNEILIFKLVRTTSFLLLKIYNKTSQQLTIKMKKCHLDKDCICICYIFLTTPLIDYLILLNDNFSLGINRKVICLEHLACIKRLQILDVDLASLKKQKEVCNFGN